jgi:DNA-binding transcriptional MerR regulator
MAADNGTADSSVLDGPAGGPDRFFTITELSAELGITPRTIRFYETKGLLKPRRVGTSRIYSRRDRGRLILILRDKRLGFTLRDIKEYLDLYVVDTTQIEQIQMLLKGVRRRIAGLEEQRAALEATVRELKDIEKLALDALRAKGISGRPGKD